MESEKFDLVFSGQVLPKQEVDQVKANMSALFKVSAAQIDALFSGKAVVLKRNLDLAAANRYRVAIKKAGARVDLVKSGEASAKAAAPKVEAIQPEPQSQQAAPVVASEPASAPEPLATLSVAKNDVAEAATSPEQKSPSKTLGESFTLSAAGADLLNDDERQRVEAVSVDTSALSIRENTGNLLDEGEWQRELPVAVADLDADILPAGSNLLNAKERAPEVKANVNDLQADIAPAGSRLESERPAPPPAPNVDHIQLAD